jgi:hypothetical protein
MNLGFVDAGQRRHGGIGATKTGLLFLQGPLHHRRSFSCPQEYVPILLIPVMMPIN